MRERTKSRDFKKKGTVIGVCHILLEAEQFRGVVHNVSGVVDESERQLLCPRVDDS